jgi:rare lipoprotein A
VNQMPRPIPVKAWIGLCRLPSVHFEAFLVFCLVLSGCAREVHRTEKPSTPAEYVTIEPDARIEPTLRPYRINGVKYYPIPDSEGFVEYGGLSWYGGKFHGRATASGEIYDMYKRSAAHKTLPMGTWVRVVNLTNGREAVVRINDRGPFVKGRILDLSYASAKELGLIGPGVARGKVVALAPEVKDVDRAASQKPVVDVSSLQTGLFSVQVGAFLNRNSAKSLAEKLKVLFDDVTVTMHSANDGKIVHRVRVSRARSISEAERIERRLTAMGFADAFVVRL